MRVLKVFQSKTITTWKIYQDRSKYQAILARQISSFTMVRARHNTMLSQPCRVMYIFPRIQATLVQRNPIILPLFPAKPRRTWGVSPRHRRALMTNIKMGPLCSRLLQAQQILLGTLMSVLGAAISSALCLAQSALRNLTISLNKTILKHFSLKFAHFQLRIN